MSAELRQSCLTLSDGTSLKADIWIPEGTGPWPTLLMRQPYGRSIASTVTLAHPTWWTSKGFLVVIQDVRGQGDSGGCFGGFAQEASDTQATHAWVRGLPECNGRLGCYGFSYQGLTQLLAAEDAPAPDCLAPAMTGLDERLHWSCEGDAHWWHLGLGWGLQLAALQARRRGDHQAWDAIRRSLEDGSYLRDGKALLKRHDPEGMALRWLEQDPSQHQDWMVHRPPSAWLRQPMLLLGGWWDPHLLGVLDLWRRSVAVGGTPQLHIGPASHLEWWGGAQTLLLKFFETHLKGEQAKAMAPAMQLWNLTSERWQQPEPSSALHWQLIGDGSTCLDPEQGRLQEDAEGAGELTIVHDPWRPAPAIGGHLSPSAGPADRRSIDARSDVATFSSAPCLQAMTLQGQPQLSLDVHADQPGFDLCVALSRLPAGREAVEQLSTGMLRQRGQDAMTSLSRCVVMQPLLATLNPGDRLRLSIAGAAWPAIGVNSGSPDVDCDAPSANHRVIAMTLRLAGSQLTLNPLDSGRLQPD